MIKKCYPFIALLIACTPLLSVAAEQEQLSQEEKEAKALATMFPEEAPSEEDVYRTDRLLISATGSLKPVRLAPSVATVITKEDIEQMGSTTLDQALESVPGLHISPSPKHAMSSIYSLRGIHTSVNPQALLLLNGVPLADAYTGSRSFFRLPVATISRIEVVRGPGSAIHGADAFAGVINIITKDGQEIDGTTGGARGGSFNSYEGWIQHGNMYNGWNIGLSMEYQQSDGDTERKLDTDLQSNLDAAFGTSASRTPDQPLATGGETFNTQLSVAKDGLSLRLFGHFQDDNAADGVTQTVADHKGKSKQLVAQLTYEKEIWKDLQTNLDLSYNYMHQEWVMNLFPENSILLIGGDGNINFARPAALALFPDGVLGLPIQIDNQLNIESATLYEGFNNQRWRLALGFRHIKEKYEESKNFGPGVSDNLAAMPTVNIIDGSLTDVTGTPYIYMDDQDRNIYYLSLQDEWHLARTWELTAGVRYDHYSDFGDTINPRVALVWETRYDLTSKLMYGRAFRPPSFNELYVKNNPSNNGNPALEPESIDTYELAFSWEPTGDLTLGSNFFYYDIKNLIELVQDPGQTTLTAQNAKDQDGYGFELEGTWQALKTLQIRGNMAFQHSEDKASGERVADASGLQFYLNGNWQFLPNHSLDLQYYWIGDRERAVGDTRETISDYSLVNLTLHRTNIAKHWNVTLAARNLLGENIREPSQAVINNDYPMEGRSFWAEVSFHF